MSAIVESGKLTAGMVLRQVRVDISGASRLRRLNTDAGDGINSDHAAWGAARVE